MKIFYALCICLVAGASSLMAQDFQRGTITKNDGTTTQGRVAIDNTNQEVIFKTDGQTTTVPFNSIRSVTMGTTTMNALSLNETSFLAATLVEGKATLYKVASNEYYIVNENGRSQQINIKQDEDRIPGTLAVLFSDCNEIRSRINGEDSFSESDLIAYTEQYNNCAYSAYSPTENEAAMAARHNTDKMRWYFGLGANFNSIAFFDSSDTENQTAATVHAGVATSPSFTGSLQGNLYFYLEGTAGFSGDKDFSNSPEAANFRVNHFRLIGGTEFHFNKNGGFQPFIGAGIGTAGDYFKGTYQGYDFEISGGNVFFAPSAGVVFPIGNGKALGLKVTYLTEYDNDLTFPIAQDTPLFLEVDSQHINASVNFYF